MSQTATLAELAEAVQGSVRGDETVRIAGVAGLSEAGADQITWMAHARYADRLSGSRAAAVVVRPDFGPTPMPAVLHDQPDWAIAVILERFAPPPDRPPRGVHPSAVIDPSATLSDSVAVGPHVIVGPQARIGERTILHGGCYVGAETTIGDDCELFPAVVIRERCTLGHRVVLHPGAIVGADGFGYVCRNGVHQKVPQIGTVVIEDDVEIGANACVDRAKIGRTLIGRGTKIDNLVQIAHNVTIGPGCILAGQVGLSGSVTLGSYVLLGGQVGVADHVRLGDGLQAGAQAGLTKSLPAGAVVNGMPAVDNRQHLREQARVRQLPKLSETVKDLLRRVDALERSTDDSGAV